MKQPLLSLKATVHSGRSWWWCFSTKYEKHIKLYDTFMVLQAHPATGLITLNYSDIISLNTKFNRDYQIKHGTKYPKYLFIHSMKKDRFDKMVALLRQKGVRIKKN